MKQNGLLDKQGSFFVRLSRSNTSGQIWHMRAEPCCCPLDQNGVVIHCSREYNINTGADRAPLH